MIPVLIPNPRLQLETLFRLDDRGRIVSTREPQPTRGPAFILIRGATACAWAIRADVRDDVADALDALALQEPPSMEWDQPPLHAQRYQNLLNEQFGGGP